MWADGHSYRDPFESEFNIAGSAAVHGVFEFPDPAVIRRVFELSGFAAAAVH